MDGLYFYKLVSPYSEDVTKDCKLTVTEIDHNFITLKDAQINKVEFNKGLHTLTLIRKNGDEISTEIPDYLDVQYDSSNGVIVIKHDEDVYTIDGLITNENIGKQAIIDSVNTDSTLVGLGNKVVALRVSPLEKTGFFRPAITFMDLTKCDTALPLKGNQRGDRYITYESVSNYGYLYDFKTVQMIDKYGLKNGWRVPTKEDWDSMLNAIEPCEEDKNHDEKGFNIQLGKFAGKYVKADHDWDKDYTTKYDDVKPEIFDADDYEETHILHPHKSIDPTGDDRFGFKLLPAGYCDGGNIYSYFGELGYYWTSTECEDANGIYIKVFDAHRADVGQVAAANHALYSLRLVKDYTGNNHHNVEFIGGRDYNTVLMPSTTGTSKQAIWTAENVALDDFNHIGVNATSSSAETRYTYFMAEWDGAHWHKKEMLEGDAAVLLSGKTSADTPNEQYQIISGQLVSVNEITYQKTKKAVEEDIFNVMGSGFTDDEGNIITITDKVKQVEEDLETFSAQTVDAIQEIKEDIWEIEEEIQYISGEVSSFTEDVANIKDAVGLDEDGKYKHSDNPFISGASSVTNSIDTIANHIISGGTSEANTSGLLKLHLTKDNDIEIQLNGDYGLVPKGFPL